MKKKSERIYIVVYFLILKFLSSSWPTVFLDHTKKPWPRIPEISPRGPYPKCHGEMCGPPFGWRTGLSGGNATCCSREHWDFTGRSGNNCRWYKSWGLSNLSEWFSEGFVERERERIMGGVWISKTRVLFKKGREKNQWESF